MRYTDVALLYFLILFPTKSFAQTNQSPTRRSTISKELDKIEGVIELKRRAALKARQKTYKEVQPLYKKIPSSPKKIYPRQRPSLQKEDWDPFWELFGEKAYLTFGLLTGSIDGHATYHISFDNA